MGISRLDHSRNAPYDRHLAYILDSKGRPIRTELIHDNLPHLNEDTPSNVTFTHLPAKFHDPRWNFKKQRWQEGKINWGRITLLVVVILGILFLAINSHAQTPVAVTGVPHGTSTSQQATVTCTDANHCAIDVNIAGGGGSGGTASTFGAAFPATGTAAGFKDSTGTNMAAGNLDASGNVKTNCAVGCSGGATTPADGFANPTTAGLSFDFLSLWNGATWDRWKGDATNGAFVNVKTSVLPTGAAADSSLTTIDTDLKANITLHAGSAIIGKVTTDQTTHGTTDLVAADITKVGGAAVALGQAAMASSIPVALASNQASIPVAATLSAETTKNIGTIRVTGNVGGVLDAIGQNVAAPANWLSTGCTFFTTPTTITNGNGSYFECDAAGNLLVNLKTALPTGANTIGKVDLLGNSAVALDAAIGAAAPANVLAEGLKDTAGNSQAALSDTNGRQIVKQYPDTTTTSYHASKKFAASSTTDVAVMPGNATNKVILDKVTLTCTQTTAAQINVELVKRSAADTAGTSAAITAVPDYSAYAGAVSAPLSYTGTGPTVGAAVGDLDNAQIGCMAAATATPNDIYVFRPAKPIILNGTAEQVAINLGGALTGGNITVTFDWRETTTP